MPKILVASPASPLSARLQALLPPDVVVEAVPSAGTEDFARAAADADVLVFMPAGRVDAATLAAAPRVRFIQRYGAGYDGTDIAATNAAGVPVAYTPGANAISVAEHTIMLMLALLKHLSPVDRAVRGGGWLSGAALPGGIGELGSATVGLVGLGAIGSAVAERLRPFGPRVLYTTRRRVDAGTEERLGATHTTLPELLADSTIVSLHLPLIEETRGLIGAAELARMQPGALLINTSRGGLVDEAALLDALTRGHLGGAGLDVLQQERAGGNPFTDLSNVIVTSHISGSSRPSGERIVRMAAANITRFLAGEPPQHLVPGSMA